MTSANSSGKPVALENGRGQCQDGLIIPMWWTLIWASATASPGLLHHHVLPVRGRVHRGRPRHRRHRDHQGILFYTHVSVGVFTRAHPFFLSRLLDSANGWTTCGCLAIFSRLKGRKNVSLLLPYDYRIWDKSWYSTEYDYFRTIGRWLWLFSRVLCFVYSVRVGIKLVTLVTFYFSELNPISVVKKRLRVIFPPVSKFT